MPLGKDADAGDYVKDFQKSKAPQFKGKSKEKRRKMAVAAFLANRDKKEQHDWGTDEATAHAKKVTPGQVSEEMMFRVSVEGLPDMIMLGRSPGDIKGQLRKIVKQPSMITDVERMTKSEVKKRYRDMAKEPIDEDVDPTDTGGAEEVDMAMTQIKAARHFLDGIEARVRKAGDMEEWFQNKLTKAHDYLKTLYAYGKGDMQEGAGLWANIHKKRKEGRPMRKPGSKGAPTKQDFDNARATSEGSETWEAGYKRRVVKTTKPEHKEKGYKWRIKGKDRPEISIKLYKEKPSQAEFNKQMKRVAGHEFGG